MLSVVQVYNDGDSRSSAATAECGGVQMPEDEITPRGNPPMVTPIVHAVNYEYQSFDVLQGISDGVIAGYAYHRDNNPTVRAVEQQLAALEGGEVCILATTGMAACTLVYLSFLSAGDHVVLFHDSYGAHYKVSLLLERMGVTFSWLDASRPEDIPAAVKDTTRLIFCETPTNPLCKTIDLMQLHEQAARVGALLVVDNTFATPYHQHPLQLGADIVVHSATKALGGHNDLMAGAVICNRELAEIIWYTRQAIGTTLDAFSASLLERGIKTFPLRAEKMASNAQAVAEYLDGRPEITNLHYPGLPGDQGHAVAKMQMKRGFGGVTAFDVGASLQDARSFISGLKTIVHAVSLGATESLICIPYLTTMLYLPEERRTSAGVNKNTVRLAVGIEDETVLIADLEQALEGIPHG